MEKKLYEVYKAYFRVGAAVGGLFYNEEPSKGPFVDSEILAKHFNKPLTDILYDKDYSNIVKEETKKEAK